MFNGGGRPPRKSYLYMDYIGKRIRIIRMDDEFSGNRYNGKEGVVEHVDGIGQLHGTWGGLAVIPEVDTFVVVED